MCQVECQDPAYLFPTALCLGPHLSGSKHACPFVGARGGVSFLRPQCLPGGFGLGWAPSRRWMALPSQHPSFWRMDVRKDVSCHSQAVATPWGPQ